MVHSIRDLERVIRRKEMNRGQTTLLKCLYETDEAFVERDAVVDAIRWGDHESFVGVLSAFSNRVDNTDGITDNPGYEAFVERRDIGGKEKFRLREEARTAIDQVSALTDVFEEWSMAELLDNDGVPVEFEPSSLGDEFSDPGHTPRWRAETPEDRLLAGYWNDVGGTIVTEVQIGTAGPSTWPDGSGRRRIDGLRFQSEYRDEIDPPSAFTGPDLREIVADRHVEVIEVKTGLNRPVIGQAIAGQDMFQRDYDPRTVEPVVVCGSSDPALEWVCRRNGIRVEIVNPGEYETRG